MIIDLKKFTERERPFWSELEVMIDRAELSSGKLDSQRVEKVEDIARVGDELTVMVINIDGDGRIRLSRQAVLEGWTAEEAMEHDRGAARRPRPDGDRGGERRGPRRPPHSGGGDRRR